MIFVSRLRGRAVQQTSQLERVWGVLFWEEGLQSGLPNLLWHHRDAPNCKKMYNFEQTPDTAWCNLARWPKELYGPPPFVALFLRPEGAMRPRSIAPLVAQS